MWLKLQANANTIASLHIRFRAIISISILYLSLSLQSRAKKFLPGFWDGLAEMLRHSGKRNILWVIIKNLAGWILHNSVCIHKLFQSV